MTLKVRLAFGGSFLSFSRRVCEVKIGTLAGVPSGKLGSCTLATSHSASSPSIVTDAAASRKATDLRGFGGLVQPGELSSFKSLFRLLARLSPAGAHRHLSFASFSSGGPLQSWGMWVTAFRPHLLHAWGFTKYHLPDRLRTGQETPAELLR